MGRVKRISDALPALKQAFLREAEKDAHAVADDLQRIQRELYERTTKHWNDSGVNQFAKPSPEFIVQIIRSSDGVIIRIRSVMKAGGTPSKLWYWLDGGTRTRIQKRRSPPIKERAALRTKPGDLDAAPFPGFTGKVFVIPAGRKVRGIPARGWSKAVVQLTQEKWTKQRGFKVTEIKYG